MRALVSVGIFEETEDGAFKHNNVSLKLTDSTFTVFALGL